jgi:hypothetical protein
MVFRVHFNRVAMQRGDPAVWSVRTSKGCYHAPEIEIQVPCTTVYKPEGSQPRAFFKGRGRVFAYRNKIVIMKELRRC